MIQPLLEQRREPLLEQRREDDLSKIVQPVPAPVSTSAELNNNNKLNGNNQKLILFNRGNAISAAPIKIGTIIFPNPPIKAGIFGLYSVSNL